MYDEEIEKAILYYIIFEKEPMQIEEIDFVNDKNIKIARAILELIKEKKEISILSVQSKIKANQSQVLEYLSILGNNIYGISPNTAYTRLKELTKKRKIFNLAKNIIRDIEDTDNVDEYAQDCIRNVNLICKEEEKEETLIQQIANTTDVIEKNYRNKNDYSLYTGIYDLDSKTCGLHNQELTIIGARPGMGKTTLTLQIAEKISSRGKNVLFISLEMSETQLIQKLISRESRVNSYKMRMGNLVEEDWDKIAKASIKLSELNLRINTKIRTIQALEVYAKKLKNSGNLDLVIIDYIQLLKSREKFNSREQEVAEISRKLKLLSLDLDIPIIALCQLNRNAENTEPTLADLRESGSLEQDKLKEVA